MVQRGQQHRGPQAQAGGPHRQRSQHREECGEVAVVGEVVLRQPHRVKAERVGPGDLLEGLLVEAFPRLPPRGRVAEVVPGPEAQPHASCSAKSRTAGLAWYRSSPPSSSCALHDRLDAMLAEDLKGSTKGTVVGLRAVQPSSGDGPETAQGNPSNEEGPAEHRA